jgi:sigma-E factor negative regulatory protein RseA
MNEYKEQLSALIDGALSDDEIHRLQPSVEAAELSTSSRYQLIAESMRGTDTDASLIDISDQVRVAILQEPALDVKTTTAASSTSAGWPVFAWLRSAGGIAVAASVAVVLVLVVTITGVQSPTSGPVVASENANQSGQVLATLPATSQRVVIPVNDDVRPNLNSYLNAHSEFAAQDTAQGRMPYARAVTYETRN